MSVDATQFCLCRNPTNCLLSVNKSVRRCFFCIESVKHDKSVGLTHSRVKTDIELLIFLVLSVWHYQKRSWKYVKTTEKIGKVTTTFSLIWGHVYTDPDKFLHGRKLAAFNFAFTRDRWNWTDFWTAKFETCFLQSQDDSFFNLNQIYQLEQRFRFCWLNRSY